MSKLAHGSTNTWSGEGTAHSSPSDLARPGVKPEFGVSDLQTCLATDNFTVEFQPKVALIPNSTSQFGVEALCRMHDARHGKVPPDTFIAIAERHGLIEKLTDGVFQKSFLAWHDWCRAGLRLRLALNVSPVLLQSSDWCDSFLDRCAQHAVDPRWITLEITETAAGATGSKASEILHRLQKKGFSLSIDDFGTGFSSLATLYKLPISEMKIDKSFILDLQTKLGARDLVESAIAMAKRLGIKVVAEGVETEGLFRQLRQMGCDEAQGYFVGKSMRPEEVVGFFTSWNSMGPDSAAPVCSGQKLPKIAVVQTLLNELANDLVTPKPMTANAYAGVAVSGGNGASAMAEIERLPSLILSGKSVAALAVCDSALQKLGAVPGSTQAAAKLSRVWELLEDELLSTGEMEIRSAYETFRLLPRDSIAVGRPSGSPTSGVAVKCRWLGPVDKSLRIFRRSGDYFLEDLGGGNKYLVNGQPLRPKHAVEIGTGRTVIEIRLASGAIAPLWLRLLRKSSDPDAVAMDLDCDKKVLRADLGEKEWLEIKEQLGTTWLIFSEKIHVGKSQDCAMVLSDCTTAMAAQITFQGGLRLEPTVGCAFAVDDHLFHRSLPLVANCELNLGGSKCLTRTVGDDIAGAATLLGAKKSTDNPVL